MSSEKYTPLIPLNPTPLRIFPSTSISTSTPTSSSSSSTSSAWSAPPAMRSSSLCTSPATYSSPGLELAASPFREVKGQGLSQGQGREIVMGGLVSRPTSPDGGEKGSIEFPGIVLTEPHPTRSPTNPKSILLLPPTSLPLPHPHDPSARPGGLLDSVFGSKASTAAVGLRALMVLGVVVLGMWHVWMVLGDCSDAAAESTQSL